MYLFHPSWTKLNGDVTSSRFRLRLLDLGSGFPDLGFDLLDLGSGFLDLDLGSGLR